MVTLAPSLAIMLTFLLAPGLIALVLDRSPGRAVARGVLLFGLAAAVGPAKTLWEGGLAMPTAIQLMTDPLIFGTAWAAAAVGWLVGEVAPIVVEMVLTSSRKVRILKLEAARAKYAEERGQRTKRSARLSARLRTRTSTLLLPHTAAPRVRAISPTASVAPYH
jgi:hypothetical protein